MKSFPLAILFSILATMSHAADVRFYIGTYTNKPPSEGIYVCDLDSESGKLGPVRLAAAAHSPNFLALSPDEKFLYADTETAGGSVAAFSVAADGKLTLVNEQEAGHGACHVSVDHAGHNVLTAAYDAGRVSCFPIGADGSTSAPTASVQFTGSGPDPVRQKKPFAHSIYTDSADRFAYACDLGTDNVWVFKFDPAHGTLTAAEPASAKVPPGSGPRHLAIHPGGSFVYVTNEMGLSVTAFERDPETGALTVLGTVPTLPPGVPTKGSTTSEIFCHPSGKWLYVSNRGADTITVFAIGVDGNLKWLESAPANVKMPRGFGIDPTGHWLVAAGQNDNRIAVLKIDQQTGKLSATDQSAKVGAPVCVLFAAGK